MAASLLHVVRSRWMARATALVLLVWASTAASPAMQAPTDIAVVVNPGVPVENLSIVELRRILLGDREFWASGVRVTLLIRAPVARERDAAVKNVCQMTEAQFRQHWIGKVFRADTPSGPKIVYSNEMAIDQASRVPGAIAFVTTPVTNKSVKVLKIDGRSPGQAGYGLR
jgi:hypothetical protein